MSRETTLNGIADADLVTAGGRGHLVEFESSNERIDLVTDPSSTTQLGMLVNNDPDTAGDQVTFVYAGIATGIAAEALEPFDEVTSATDSEFAKYVAGSGNVVVGRFVPAQQGGTTNLPDAAAGQTIRVYLYARKEARLDGAGTLKAVYDFAVDGGGIGSIASGAFFPDNAVVYQSAFDLITTAASATDAGTMAVTSTTITIDAAVAISAVGDAWDGPALREGDHQSDDDTTWEKTVAREELSFVIAVEAFTAGKFVAFANYWIGE